MEQTEEHKLAGVILAKKQEKIKEEKGREEEKSYYLKVPAAGTGREHRVITDGLLASCQLL